MAGEPYALPMPRVHVVSERMKVWGDEALVTQVFIHGPRQVRCEFGTAEEELELLSLAQAGQTVVRPADLLGGAGSFTIMEEDGGRVEVYGSVRDLAPLLREIADAFEARLSDLP
jgi:hypothetical protein